MLFLKFYGQDISWKAKGTKKENIVIQDNNIGKEKEGILKEDKHIKVRYFFIKDKVE